MALTPVTADDCLARLDAYDAIIDARSEGEFALDRIPGAVNWPSLNDAERALVGTEYKQISPFVARKRGAALVARNIAMHIERHVLDKPKDWQPLVYCWRGGQRCVQHGRGGPCRQFDRRTGLGSERQWAG